MSKGITEVFQASEDPCDVIIRQRGKDIKLTRLEGGTLLINPCTLWKGHTNESIRFYHDGYVAVDLVRGHYFGRDYARHNHHRNYQSNTTA